MKAGRLTATAASIRVVRSPIAVNLLVHFFINSWLMVEGFAGHFLLISKPKSIKFFKRTKKKAQFEQPQVRTELWVLFCDHARRMAIKYYCRFRTPLPTAVDRKRERLSAFTSLTRLK